MARACHQILALPSEGAQTTNKAWVGLLARLTGGAQYLSTQRVAKMPNPSLLVLFKSSQGHSREGLSLQPDAHSAHA